MKSIELIFLIGSQCVSPVEAAPGFTEVAKVQCAVVIERDTETNLVIVTPESAASIPRVAEAMRMPQRAIPVSAPPEPVQGDTSGQAGVVRMEVSPPATPEEPEVQQPEAKVAEPEAEPAEPKPKEAVRKTTGKKKTAAAGKPKDVCGAGRKAVWYTSSPGHRKYRCRSASGEAPATRKTSSTKKTRKSLY
ncbi:hypothetical protein [Aestuariivirga sp.]|uniref:hypothetical protein n=1 Tax=Aestuariivirga sp. TaxID=2650926 RepID=UPI003593F05F